MSALALASAPVPRVASGRHAASTGRRATRPDAPHPAPGSRALGSRRRRNAWRIVVAAVDPDDVERPGSDRDDYADWKAAKDDTSEAFKRAAAQAGRKEDFVVGATPLDEKMLSRVMLQLLNNHVIYHGRTAFKDNVQTGEDRMLMRLWLSVPNSRALPPDHAVLWGDVGSGKPHGGIAQPAAALPA